MKHGSNNHDNFDKKRRDGLRSLFTAVLGALMSTACGGSSSSSTPLDLSSSPAPSTVLSPPAPVSAPSPAAPPAPPPPPPPVTALTMDEAQVTSVSFSTDRPWRNLNGDWLDALGVAQGNTPFAQVPSQGVFSNEARPIVVEITSLVREWVVKGNRGALLRKGPVRRWATRNYPDPALRPYLIVDGARRECLADAELDRGTELLHLGTAPTMDTFGGEGEIQRAALQFDVSGITSVQSATLHLVELRAEGSGPVEIYQLDPPPAAAP